MSAMDCQGTWGTPREIGSDSGITVARCSGCRDLMVIYRYRSVAVPPDSTDADIARRVWESVGRL